MRIGDRPEFKTKMKPLTAAATDNVFNVAAAMNERNFGSVVIVSPDDKVVGIFTERDLLRRVVARGIDPRITPMADVMTKEIRVASASDDVIDWLRQMSNERFRHLPVVNDEGKLVHMMSQGDFVSYTWPELLARVKQEVSHAYPKFSPLLWLFLGLAAYTLIMIMVLRFTM